MNSYVDLAAVKSTLGITATDSDAELLSLTERVSREIDGYTGRFFYSLTATRYFSGANRPHLLVPDLIAVTTLKEDSALAGTYDRTWAATDYALYPYDAAPTGPAGLDTTKPFWRIEVDWRTGAYAGFFSGTKRYEIAGRWGYSESVRRASETATVLSTTTTTLTASAATDVRIGHTLLVGGEQLYVTAISGTTYTVRRGVNGTTAAAHDAGTAIDIIEYPPEVVEAATVEVVRIWQMRLAHYASSVGQPETGEVRVLGGGMRNITKEFLAPYRRSLI